jgi:hypothetical protein
VTETLAHSWTGREPLLISAAAAGVLVCRLIGVSHGDSTTSILLLSTANASTTFLALVIVVGQLAPCFWCAWAMSEVIAATIAAHWATARKWELRYLAGLCVALVLTPMLLTFGLGIMGVYLWLVVKLLARWSRSWRWPSGGGKVLNMAPTADQRRGMQWSIRGVGILFLAVFFGFALFNTRPWLPAERFAPSQGPVFTAYVLRESPESLVVMRDNSRTVVRIDPATIKARTFCTTRSPETGVLWQSLITLLLHDATRYQKCPSARR